VNAFCDEEGDENALLCWKRIDTCRAVEAQLIAALSSGVVWTPIAKAMVTAPTSDDLLFSVGVKDDSASATPFQSEEEDVDELVDMSSENETFQSASSKVMVCRFY
jgi:hypothetical protein